MNKILILVSICLALAGLPGEANSVDYSEEQLIEFKRGIKCSISKARMLLQIMRIDEDASQSTPEREFLYAELVGLFLARSMDELEPFDSEICSVLLESEKRAHNILADVLNDYPEYADSLSSCSRKRF